MKSKPEFTIRTYADNDWSAVCVVHDLARPLELEGSCDPRAFVPLAEEKEDIADFNESSKFVAEIAGEVVGFSGVKDNVVTWLYVKPEFAGNGIGKQLLLSALELIDGEAFTYVLAGNEIALKVYTMFGFTKSLEFDSDCAGYPCTCLKLVKAAANA